MVLPLLAALAAGGAALWAADEVGLFKIEEVSEAMGELTVTSAEAVWTASKAAIRGNEVNFTAGLTVLMLSLVGFWAIKAAALPYRKG